MKPRLHRLWRYTKMAGGLSDTQLFNLAQDEN